MACPFFMPIAKFDHGAWPYPGRLPLGGGWSGRCRAPGHEGEIPSRAEMEEFCNLGYASTCGRLPRDRAWDAVRFAVISSVQPFIIQLRYVCERNHQPVDHGRLEFDADRARWIRSHADECVQKMAECFLESHLAKKKSQPVDSAAE